jgi:hypothetical protein
VRRNIPEGGESRPIDLRRVGRRTLRRVDFGNDTAGVPVGTRGRHAVRHEVSDPVPPSPSPARRRSRHGSAFAGLGLALALAMSMDASAAAAQPEVLGASVKDQAAAVLGLMAYTVVPDVNTSSLAIQNDGTGNPAIDMTQLGGGGRVSRTLPLYLEGNVAYVRFDPSFLVKDGAQSRAVAVRWNSLTATGGIGWDLMLTSELVLRPILVFSLGRVASEVSGDKWYVERDGSSEVNFLDGGRLKAIGTGGSLMLDWERVRPDHEVDVEVRYTNVRLRTRAGENDAMRSDATTDCLAVWARVRWPTGWTAFDRPVRTVLESAHTDFYGAQAGALGFSRLTSIGGGLDSTWVPETPGSRAPASSRAT